MLHLIPLYLKAVLTTVLLQSSGNITPAFSASRLTYTASAVPYTTGSVVLTIIKNMQAATVKIGNTDIAGQQVAVLLKSGANTISIVVTSANGKVSRTYRLTITRTPASTDATLRSLTISPGTLTPTFQASTLSYRATVNSGSISLTPTCNNAFATAQIYGGQSLNVGKNTVKVVVTAQSGAKRTYTITVTRV